MADLVVIAETPGGKPPEGGAGSDQRRATGCGCIRRWAVHALVCGAPGGRVSPGNGGARHGADTIHVVEHAALAPQRRIGCRHCGGPDLLHRRSRRAVQRGVRRDGTSRRASPPNWASAWRQMSPHSRSRPITSRAAHPVYTGGGGHTPRPGFPRAAPSVPGHSRRSRRPARARSSHSLRRPIPPPPVLPSPMSGRGAPPSWTLGRRRWSSPAAAGSGPPSILR